MHRKLVFNKGSYLLTLPKKWVDANQLTKQNEVELFEEENRLIILPEDYRRPHSKKDIRVTESELNNVRGILFAMVRLGYDQVKVFFDPLQKESFVKAIEHVVNNYLYGYEVIEVQDNYCIVENVLGIPENVKAIERKSFLMVKESFRELIESIEQGKLTLLRMTEYNKKMVKYDSILRHNYSKDPLQNNPFQWQKYRDGYIIQRELFNLTKLLSHKSRELHKKILPFLIELAGLFEEVYLAYFKEGDTASLERSGVHGMHICSKINQRIDKNKNVEPLVLCYIFEIARSIDLFNYSLLQLRFSESENEPHPKTEPASEK